MPDLDHTSGDGAERVPLSDAVQAVIGGGGFLIMGLRAADSAFQEAAAAAMAVSVAVNPYVFARAVAALSF